MKIILQKTWDGLAISPSEFVSVHFYYGDTHSNIEIKSPYYNNEAPPEPMQSLWRLWEFEVVEIFFVGDNQLYTELEFGPHGHYLGLQLDGPRNIIKKHIPVEYKAEIDNDFWTGLATVENAYLPEEIKRINCFAIHNCENSRRYLSYTRLPGEKPDFHQPDLFPFLEDLC